MDILPFYPILSSETENDPESVLHVAKDQDWCLFSVDVRNTYGLPFDVCMKRTQEGVLVSSENIGLIPFRRFTYSDDQDGSARLDVKVSGQDVKPFVDSQQQRFVMPIRKFLLSEDAVSKTIPTLSDRQFVVAKGKLSPAEDKVQRELFWYREELFKYIQCSWVEVCVCICTETYRV